MLVLTRKKNEEIVLGSGDQTIVIRVLDIAPDRVKVGVTAPETVSVLRRELLTQHKRGKNGVERPPAGKSV